jgi:ATP-dependent Clp protease ATP-binding subunit ClpC
MFERFTNQSRRVVVLAQEEARMLNHNYIGTEHLLLGLLHEGRGTAAQVLTALDVTLPAAREQVVAVIGRGQAQPSGHIPFTPRAKKSLELSLREALQLGDGYIGTGHLLLGLIHQGDNMALKVLNQLGTDLKDVRARVTRELQEHPETDRDMPPAERERLQLRVFMRNDVQGLLDTIDERLKAIERHLGIQDAEPGESAETPAGSGTGPAGETESGTAGETDGAAGESGDLTWLRARVARLEERLREHGLDPDEPQEPPAAAS